MFEFVFGPRDTSLNVDVVVDRADLGTGTRRQRHRVSIGSEFEIVNDKSLVVAFLLEKDDHAVNLPTKLGPKTGLKQLRDTDLLQISVLLLDINVSLDRKSTR